MRSSRQKKKLPSPEWRMNRDGIELLGGVIKDQDDAGEAIEFLTRMKHLLPEHREDDDLIPAFLKPPPA